MATLQDYFWSKPIDFSDNKYNTKGYTRLAVLEVIAEQIYAYNIGQFFFMEHNGYLYIIINNPYNDDMEKIKVRFPLQFKVTRNNGKRTEIRLSLREYLVSIFAAPLSIESIGYSQVKKFSYIY